MTAVEVAQPESDCALDPIRVTQPAGATAAAEAGIDIVFEPPINAAELKD